LDKKLLKNFKNNISAKDGILKRIKYEYCYLQQYSNDEILKYFHVDNVSELQEFIGLNIISDFKKNSNTCMCLDKYGNIKTLYKRYESAQDAAFECDLNLKIYPCPYEMGWHLSSQ